MNLIASLIRCRGTQPKALSREPLDHPCLAHLSLAEMGDLPLPAYSVEPDGSVRITLPQLR